MAQLNFDARTVAPDTGGGDPLPAGWYNVMIDESGKKPTSDGQGAYLETRYNVLDGQHAGRKLFSRFNTENNSPKAVEIAYKQLSALCHATGVLVVQDSQQLHGIPLKIKVALRDARTDQATGKSYEASNEVKAWKNINEPIDAAPAGAAPMGGGVPAGFGPPVQAAAPMGWAPQQPQQPVQQQPQQPAQAQPWQQPGVAQQPAAAQPWQPQAPQQAAVAPPVQQPWQQQPQQAPQQPAQGQPWQPQAQAPAQVQQPAQQPQQAAPWAGANPATATPPWQQPR